MSKKQQLQKHSAADIYNAIGRGFDLECPSGVTVVVKAFNIHDYLKHGIIPDDMLAVVMEAATQGVEGLITQEDVTGFFDFMSIVVSESLITPKAVLDPDTERDEQTVCVWNIPAGDRLAIYNFAMSGYTEEVQKWLPLSAAAKAGSSTSSPGATASAPASSPESETTPQP